MAVCVGLGVPGVPWGHGDATGTGRDTEDMGIVRKVGWGKGDTRTTGMGHEDHGDYGVPWGRGCCRGVLYGVPWDRGCRFGAQ